MSRHSPFEKTFRAVGAILDAIILDLPVATALFARDFWQSLPWSAKAQDRRRWLRQKLVNGIYEKNRALYGNHTPAFRAAVTEELLHYGFTPPQKWRA